jgi:hypothetical protein
MKIKWISVKKRLPKEGQRVLAKYTGVYGTRCVLFWRDSGGVHFGEPPFSYPASHWMPLPR